MDGSLSAEWIKVKGHMNTETNEQFEVGRRAVSPKQGKGEAEGGRNGDHHLRQKLISFSFFGDFVLGEKRLLA